MSTWLSLSVLLKNIAAMIPLLQIRVLSYNPLSCKCEDRWCDVPDEDLNFDCFGHNGEVFTNCVNPDRKLGFIIVSCSFGSSPLMNRSCGVALAIKWKKEQHAQFRETVKLLLTEWMSGILNSTPGSPLQLFAGIPMDPVLGALGSLPR